MTNTQNTKTAIENITVGMKFIPAGRTRAIEALIVDAPNAQGDIIIGHMGRGFDVTKFAANTLVTVAA